jgi:hypothetical protein
MLSHKKANGSISKGVKKLEVPLPDIGRGKKNHNFFGSKKPPPWNFTKKCIKVSKSRKREKIPWLVG